MRLEMLRNDLPGQAVLQRLFVNFCDYKIEESNELFENAYWTLNSKVQSNFLHEYLLVYFICKCASFFQKEN